MINVCRCCGRQFEGKQGRVYCSDQCRGKAKCIVCGKLHNHRVRQQLSKFCLECDPDSVRVCDYHFHNEPLHKFVWEDGLWNKVYLQSSN